MITMIDGYNLILEHDREWIQDKTKQYGISRESLELPIYKEKVIKSLGAEITNLYIYDLMNKLLNKEYNKGIITKEDKDILSDSIRTNCRDSRFDISEEERENLSDGAKNLVNNF